MLYCDAATFCRRRNDAGIMTAGTGRRCAQESIDIIIMKNNYNYLFIIKIILITYLEIDMLKSRSKYIALALVLSITMVSCDKEEYVSEIDIEIPSNSSKLEMPKEKRNLTTTTHSDVSFRPTFTNGGDISDNMNCIVHWRKYSSKPTKTPKASDMNNHESMRIYTRQKYQTVFDKSHTGFDGGQYIYYYFECSNNFQ